MRINKATWLLARKELGDLVLTPPSCLGSFDDNWQSKAIPRTAFIPGDSGGRSGSLWALKTRGGEGSPRSFSDLKGY